MDITDVEKLEGVRAVLTYEDPEVKKLKVTNAGWTDGVDILSYDRMMWYPMRDRRVIGDYARWVGDEIGLVVAAESESIAEEALKLVKIEWEILPFVLDPVEAMKPEAPSVHPELRKTNVLPEDPVGGPDVFVEKGDVEKGFSEADVVVESTAVHHNPNQGSLDNWCCLMEWKGDTLTVWSNSYEAHQTRMHISQMLDLPLSKVRVICSFVGGQFGRNDTGEQPFFLYTALLAKRTGRPVKFRHNNRESFLNSRQPAIYTAKAGAKKDGAITAMTFKSIGDAGAYADHTMFALKFGPAEIAEVALAHVPNLKLEAYGVYTNKLPACMMRGVANSQFNLSFGQIVDVLAEKLDMDPIDLSIKNFGHEEEALPNKSLVEVLHEGARRIGWENRHKPGEGPVYEHVRKRGMGFSFHPGWHAEWQEVRRGRIQVSLMLNPDGTVMLEAPTVETGSGSNTCNLLGCLEALSFLAVRPEDVHYSPVVDTETSLRDCVQTDSSVSYLQSEAMMVAAADLKRKICELAAPKLGAKPEELDIEEGNIFVKASPDTHMEVKTWLMEETDLAPIVATVHRVPLDLNTGIPFIATFAEVEVDTDTGEVDVLKLVVLHDCGTVMHASGAEAQQLGGQVMGLGEALYEEIIYDEARGVPMNFNWIDYKIATMADFPEVEPVLMEVWKGGGEYGACGIGESTLTCTPRAVLNAIYNAINVRVDELPVKPEKILQALGKI
jgi:xanthine dehydrogenase molybdenum-binding subunit